MIFSKNFEREKNLFRCFAFDLIYFIHFYKTFYVI